MVIAQRKHSAASPYPSRMAAVQGHFAQPCMWEGHDRLVEMCNCNTPRARVVLFYCLHVPTHTGVHDNGARQENTQE